MKAVHARLRGKGGESLTRSVAIYQAVMRRLFFVVVTPVTVELRIPANASVTRFVSELER